MVVNIEDLLERRGKSSSLLFTTISSQTCSLKLEPLSNEEIRLQFPLQWY